jgi:hypothetical protein
MLLFIGLILLLRDYLSFRLDIDVFWIVCPQPLAKLCDIGIVITREIFRRSIYELFHV